MPRLDIHASSFPPLTDPLLRRASTDSASLSLALSTCKPSSQGRPDFSANARSEEMTMAQQKRLLTTETVRLNTEGLNVRYAELGDPVKPPVLLLHGVPENLQG